MANYIILAQITGIIAWLLLIYSYYKDEINKLLFVQIISSIFDCVSYLLLGAYSGLIVCIIELLQGIGYYKTDKDNLIFLISIPIYIVLGILTCNGVIALLPIVGSIIDSFSLTKNKNIATIGGIISNALWLVYDVIVLAYVSAASDAVFIISNTFLLLFGYSRLLKTNKLRIVQAKSFSRNIYNTIYKLDKKTYGEEYTWSFDYEKDISNKNENYMSIIKYYNEIVGYINYLVINELEYSKIINSPTMINEYDINNIVKYQKNRKNYLVIDSINIKNKFQNEIAINLIIKKIKKIITKSDEKGYKIQSIISTAVNEFEKEILEKVGFTKYKEYSKNETLYMIDNKTIEELYLKNIKENRERRKYKVHENSEINELLLRKISELDKKNYQDEYLWDNDYQSKVFNKNKNSLIAVTYENKLIGYLNYLVIKKEKYEEIINSNITIDSYNLDEITTFYKNKNNYLTINSIVIDKKYQNGITIKLLTKRLKKTLKKFNTNKYNIAGINGIAISKDGQKFLENLGFEKIKTLKDNNTLYVLEKDKLKKYLK